MGDKVTHPETPNILTIAEQLQRQYDKESRHLKISRTRGALVRKQILTAYEILENIRFDHIGDTAFRDKITRAKQALESSIADFLLDDNYWDKRMKKHRRKTPEEYATYLNRSAGTEKKASPKKV